MPILSVGLLFTKSIATAFAASILLGVRSCAVILPLTSMQRMISIPSPSEFCSSFLVCGFAKATIRKAILSILKINGKWRKEALREPMPFGGIAETRREVLRRLLVMLYQMISTGNNASSAKKYGCANFIFWK